jgi:hypothetical protein
MPLCVKCQQGFTTGDVFCSYCGNRIANDVDRRPTALVLSAADHYRQAMASSNLDVTIRELDACLCANPKAFQTMAAYFNLSAAVWEKFRFNERKGHTVGDDEYLWVLGCNLCLRRALKIYENMPRAQQLETDTLKLHQALKGSLGPTISYGSSVFMAGQWHDRKVSGLPPLRCLTDIKWGGTLDR